MAIVGPNDEAGDVGTTALKISNMLSFFSVNSFVFQDCVGLLLFLPFFSLLVISLSFTPPPLPDAHNCVRDDCNRGRGARLIRFPFNR